jgi:hypothetical protein
MYNRNTIFTLYQSVLRDCLALLHYIIHIIGAGKTHESWGSIFGHLALLGDDILPKLPTWFLFHA